MSFHLILTVVRPIQVVVMSGELYTICGTSLIKCLYIVTAILLWKQG